VHYFNELLFKDTILFSNPKEILFLLGISCFAYSRRPEEGSQTATGLVRSVFHKYFMIVKRGRPMNKNWWYEDVLVVICKTV